MNCEEFQRQILVDPYRLSGPTLDHAASCSNCAAHLAWTIKADEALVDTMRFREPNGLKPRLLLISRFPHNNARRWLRLAATVVITASALTGYQRYAEPTSAEGWAELMFSHIENNPQERIVDEMSPKDGQNTLISNVGFALRRDTSVKLLRTDACRMKRTDAVHSIVDLNGVRAVVFFLPKKIGQGNYSKDGWSISIREYEGRSIGVAARTHYATVKISTTLNLDLIRFKS